MVKKVILWIACIMWAVLIFCFSAQPAEVSNKVSVGFTENIIMFILNLDFIDIPVSTAGLEETVIKIAQSVNSVVRKCAHFGVYMIFGVLVLNLLKCYFKDKLSIPLALAFSFLYAVSDEIHQIFVPGRAGRATDVLIDFSGALLGVILFIIISKRFFGREKSKV